MPKKLTRTKKSTKTRADPKKIKKKLKAQKPVTKPVTKPQPPKQKPPVKKPTTKPEKPKKTLAPMIEWGLRLSKGGSKTVVLKGTGIHTKGEYHIRLNRGNRTWNVTNVNLKKKVTGLASIDAAKVRAEKWERKSAPEKVTTHDAPVIVTPEPEPVKKYGLIPRERDWTGKTPIWSMARYFHLKDDELILTAGVSVSFPPFRSTAQSVLKWIEMVLDQFEERGLWVTTSALKSWYMQLSRSDGMRSQLTLGEQDLFNRTLNDVIRNRTEPEEYSDKVRVETLIQQWRTRSEEEASQPKQTKETTMSTTHERTENKTVTVKGKKIKLTADVGSGEAGGKRFTILGLPMSAVLRWMGKAGWKLGDARAVMTGLGLNEVKDSTINVKLYNGRGGGAGGEIPHLTKEQVAALTKLRDDNKGKAKPAPTPPTTKKKGKKVKETNPKKGKGKINGKKSKSKKSK